MFNAKVDQPEQVATTATNILMEVDCVGSTEVLLLL
jgi:hypothetical protein